MLKGVQPCVASYRFGSVGVVHKGEFVNHRSLRTSLKNPDDLDTTSGTEVLPNLFETWNQ